MELHFVLELPRMELAALAQESSYFWRPLACSRLTGLSLGARLTPGIEMEREKRGNGFVVRLELGYREWIPARVTMLMMAVIIGTVKVLISNRAGLCRPREAIISLRKIIWLHSEVKSIKGKRRKLISYISLLGS